MKLKDLVNSKPSLLAFSKSVLPIGIAFDMKKFLKSVDAELVAYEEVRSAKVKELGEETSPETYSVKAENLLLFQSAMAEIADKEIEVVIPKISIEELKNYKDVNGNGVSISSSDLLQLDWLIVE